MHSQCCCLLTFGKWCVHFGASCKQLLLDLEQIPVYSHIGYSFSPIPCHQKHNCKHNTPMFPEKKETWPSTEEMIEKDSAHPVSIIITVNSHHWSSIPLALQKYCLPKNIAQCACLCLLGTTKTDCGWRQNNCTISTPPKSSLGKLVSFLPSVPPVLFSCSRVPWLLYLEGFGAEVWSVGHGSKGQSAILHSSIQYVAHRGH